LCMLVLTSDDVVCASEAIDLLEQKIAASENTQSALLILQDVKEEVKGWEDISIGRYYILLAAALEKENSLNESYTAYSSAIEILSQPAVSGYLVTAYIERSYLQYIKTNDPSKYCGDRHKALAAARSLDDAIHLVKALTAAAFCYEKSSRFRAGLNLLEEALDVSEKASLTVNRRAMIYNATGVLYRSRHFYERADEYLAKAYDLWAEVDDKQDMFNMLHGRVSINIKLGRFEQANTHVNKLFELAESSPGFLDFYFFSYFNAGLVAFEGKNYVEAIKNFNLAIERKDDTQEQFFIRKAYYFLSYAYFRENHFENSIQAARNFLLQNPSYDTERKHVLYAKAVIALSDGTENSSAQLLLDLFERTKASQKEQLNNSIISLSLEHDSHLSKIENQLIEKKLAINELELEKERDKKKLSTQTLVIIGLIGAMLTGLIIFLFQSRKFFKHRSQTDFLTGIANRSYVFEKGNRLLNMSKDNNQKLSTIIFDLDKFKDVNDSYGHDIGDEVIKATALQASHLMRSGDIIGRIGGEEFLILLPHTDSYKAIEIAERIRKAIANKSFRFKEVKISFSISLGVATQDNGTQHIDELIKRADEALYVAKNSGRNRTHCAD